MTADEVLAGAIKAVASREGLNIMDLKLVVPDGFWSKVLQELANAKGASGKPWTVGSIGQQWRRKKDKLIALMGRSHNVVQSGKGFLDENRVREIFQEELAKAKQATLDEVDKKLKAFEQKQGQKRRANVETSPIAPRVKRKAKGEVGHISVRVDKVLFEKFREDCFDRWKMSLSRGMDTILWHYYGKPDLSFQK
jgi:hypothetical protein